MSHTDENAFASPLPPPSAFLHRSLSFDVEMDAAAFHSQHPYLPPQLHAPASNAPTQALSASFDSSLSMMKHQRLRKHKSRASILSPLRKPTHKVHKTRRKPKLSLETAATATSSLLSDPHMDGRSFSSHHTETTVEQALATSADSSDTPFRFSSFPASLPRVRKGGVSAHQQEQQQLHVNHSHNTSVSSLHHEETDPSAMDQLDYSDDETDQQSSGAFRTHTRTRLDFNGILQTPPPDKGRPPRRKNSTAPSTPQPIILPTPTPFDIANCSPIPTFQDLLADTSPGSTSTTVTRQSARPMPDLNAFVSNGINNSSSMEDHEELPPCPPTPIRHIDLEPCRRQGDSSIYATKTLAVGDPTVVRHFLSHLDDFDHESMNVESQLGSGNFATVYQVRVAEQTLALKRSKRQYRGRRDRDCVVREIHYLQKAQGCPFVLAFIKAWQESGHFYSLTELCSTATCIDLIDASRGRGKFGHLEAKVDITEDVVYKICHDVSSGLSFLHERHIIHNDIKPANVFLTFHGSKSICKIGDFGLASDEGIKEDGEDGDQKYIAKEVLSHRVAHPSGDVFSLGVSLLELASANTFELPSDGPHWHLLRDRLSQAEVIGWRSKSLQKLVSEMMALNPAQRPLAHQVTRDSGVLASSESPSLDAFLRSVQDEELARAAHSHDQQLSFHSPPVLRKTDNS